MASIEDDDSKKNIRRWMNDVRKIIHGEQFDALLVMSLDISLCIHFKSKCEFMFRQN